MKALALALLVGCGRIGFDSVGEATPDGAAAFTGRCGAVTQSANVIEMDISPAVYGDVTLPTCADNQLLAVFSFTTACTLQVLVAAPFDSAIDVVGDRCVDNPGVSGEQVTIAGRANQVTVLAIEGCGDVRIVYHT